MTTGNLLLTDLQNHWARIFIEALVQKNVFSGFPDRTFRPDRSMTRAEFAATILKAFQQPRRRNYVPFGDVPGNNWAAPAIQAAFEMQFISGYPGNVFRPQGNITRLEVWLSLVSGLALAAKISPSVNLEQVYQDAGLIPLWARNAIALATQAGMVVNYPNLKFLEPHRNATRGEVAGIIYQALVSLGQAPELNSPYLVRTNAVAVSHRREFRGAWVTTAWNIDFPTKTTLSTSQQQAELIEILDRLQALNFNAVMMQFRVDGDALYASDLAPWSEWLTGTQGKAPEPFYDPLEFTIAQCRQRGLELHAWFNPYRARSHNRPLAHPPNHITNTHPQGVHPYGNFLWMDPGDQKIQDLTYNVIMDVVRRYDVDGVHIDDYFYPYPISGQAFPDQTTYDAYRQGGGTMSRNDWRRHNVNQMVQRLHQGIKAAKPHVRFGISPFGIYRPDQPSGIRGLDQYDQLYADPKKWLAEGWVDYIAPQLYWRIDPPAQSYRTLLNWWLDQNPQMRHVYVGNNITRLENQVWLAEEFDRQITLSRSWESRLSLGNIFYSMRIIRDNTQGIADLLKANFYQHLALPPVMPWLNPPAATPPTQVRRQGDTISWQIGNNKIQNLRCWTLYQKQGNAWQLVQILPANATSVRVGEGDYALSAVDRANRESLGITI
jgi:uncharacterized lipoprotein YddW (UPF0748 family)